MKLSLLPKIDTAIIRSLNKLSGPLARLSIFIVFFWFGALKLFDLSPANPLVSELLEKTLPFITFPQFIIWFALFEMAIGIAFLIPHFERLAIAMLAVHMVTTIMPLILLPSVTWTAPWVPTLEGQYIIKNVVIIALAVVLGARLRPMH